MAAWVEFGAMALVIVVIVVVGLAPIYATYLNRHEGDL